VRARIVPCLADKSVRVRRAAVGALATLVGDDPTIRLIVAKTLEDENDAVRAAAISVLGGLIDRDPAIGR
jgi:HEAT repeat protein